MSLGGNWLRGKTYCKCRSRVDHMNVLHLGSCERCCPRRKCRDGCKGPRSRRRSTPGGFVGNQRGRGGQRKGERGCNPRDCDVLRRPSSSLGRKEDAPLCLAVGCEAASRRKRTTEASLHRGEPPEIAGPRSHDFLFAIYDAIMYSSCIPYLRLPKPPIPRHPCKEADTNRINTQDYHRGHVVHVHGRERQVYEASCHVCL